MERFMRQALLFLAGALATAAFAQVPKPAAPQQEPMLLVGAAIHVGDGTVIENGSIAFEDGKITHVIDGAPVGLDQGRFKVIDLAGKRIYPGFILPCTDLGLVEVNQMRASVDNAERGEYNPNVRSIIAYNTDSELIPTLRYNGILLAQIAPQGGTIPGTSSIVELDGWNWEDAVAKMDDGVHLDWPARISRRFSFETFSVETRPNPRYDETVRELSKLFNNAQAYVAMAQPEDSNLKLAAMGGLFDGSKTLYVYADVAKEIVEGLTFAKDHGVQRVVLVGGGDALHVAEFLKKHQIPVILGDVHDLPGRTHEDVDLAYKKPALLKEAGVSFALSYESRMSARNLAFFAGTAAAYGLGKEAALSAITLEPAKILGIDDRVGSLAVGKDATLFVSDGDALDMRGNRVIHAFIRGKALNLPGMQQRLYERYREKYSE